MIARLLSMAATITVPLDQSQELLGLLLMCTKAPVAVKGSEKKDTGRMWQKREHKEKVVRAFLQEHSRSLRFSRTTSNQQKRPLPQPPHG